MDRRRNMEISQKALFSTLVLVIFMVGDVMGNCETILQISDASNNATGSGPFADGSALEYTCNSGYTGVGSPYYYCRGSEWAGNFSCVRACPQIKTLQHGSIIGNPAYLVNKTLKFACLEGYTINGPSSMMCMADGNWRPEAPPTCDPVSCEAFEGVPNSTVFQINPDGVLNDFRSKLRITCNDGYNLVGSSIVTCKSNGKWSWTPHCEASVCGTHPGSKSQCIYDSSTSDKGILLSLLCLDNSTNVSVTVVGTGSAFCINNHWDSLDMGCFCDCLVDTDSQEGITYHNLFNKKFVKHGDNLNWECDEGYKKQGLTNISCNDGQMESPQCIRVKKRREMTEGLPVIVIVLIICIVLICILGCMCCYVKRTYAYNATMRIRRYFTHKQQHNTKKPIDKELSLTTQVPLLQSNTVRLTYHPPLDESCA